MLTEIEKKLIAAIQGDIPITERPYKKIADGLGVSEKTVLDTLKSLTDKGVIRRFGATLRHQKSGITANAMVAWQVEENTVVETGNLFAENAAVSHCYRRDPTPDWPYNLYTMVHATSKTACLEITRLMSETSGISEYEVLFSEKELKKTSMKYFGQPLEDSLGQYFDDEDD